MSKNKSRKILINMGPQMSHFWDIFIFYFDFLIFLLFLFLALNIYLYYNLCKKIIQLVFYFILLEKIFKITSFRVYANSLNLHF